jgi:hypothetical protein
MQRGPLAVLLALLVLAGSVPVTVVAAEPTVDLAVNGTPMASGDRLVVPEDPVLSVNASARTTVERVVVRVDDRTVQTWLPGTETMSESMRLDLPNEPQEVQVVVTGSDGSVAASRVTVVKDEVAPFVGFEEPFESDPRGRPPAEVTLSASRVTLSGTLTDASDVEFVRITREHRAQSAVDYEVVSRTHVVRDPGDRFSQELFFGPGENTVRIVVQDAFGNSRTYDLSFVVADNTDPTLSFESVPAETSSSTVFVNGTATDNVQVNNVSYAVFGEVSRRSIVVGRGPTADPTREEIRFSREVELVPGPNRITVWATDTSGNEVQELVVVDYVRNVVPTLAVDEARTHLVAEESVHVYGAARDGRVSSLSVETVDESGTVVDFEQVYDGSDVWNDIEFEEELALATEGGTTVVVRAVDADGTEHVTRYAVPTTPASAAEASDDAAAPATEAPTDGSAAAEQPSEEREGSEATTSSTAVEDGGFGAFAVAALLLVVFSAARLRNATIEVPIEKYVDVEDTELSLPSLSSLPSLPSLPRLRR